MPRSLKRKYNIRGTTEARWGSTRIVTINVPEIDLDYIEHFIRETRLVPSRSEYIRVALRNQIIHDIKLTKDITKIVRDEIKLDPRKFVRVPGYNGNKPLKIVRRLE